MHPTTDRAALAELRAMAQWLAAHGYPVHPLRPSDKRPATPHGVNDASTDPGAVSAWWERTPYNIGLATGPAHLLVVDLDAPRDGRGLASPWTAQGAHNGADVLARLAARVDDTTYLRTRTVATPSGGRHLYYQATRPLPSTTSRLGPLIDTRGVGGYVVAPPSATPSGRYVTVNAAPVAPCPAWIADALTAARPDRESPDQRARFDGSPAARSIRYGPAALAEEARAVATAAPGTRNHTLNRAAFNLARLIASGDLDRSAVTATLHAAAHAAGLPGDEASRTIASGLSARAARPA